MKRVGTSCPNPNVIGKKYLSDKATTKSGEIHELPLR